MCASGPAVLRGRDTICGRCRRPYSPVRRSLVQQKAPGCVDLRNLARPPPRGAERRFSAVGPAYCLSRGWALIETATTHSHSGRCMIRVGRTTAHADMRAVARLLISRVGPSARARRLRPARLAVGRGRRGKGFNCDSLPAHRLGASRCRQRRTGRGLRTSRAIRPRLVTGTRALCFLGLSERGAVTRREGCLRRTGDEAREAPAAMTSSDLEGSTTWTVVRLPTPAVMFDAPRRATRPSGSAGCGCGGTTLRGRREMASRPARCWGRVGERTATRARQKASQER